MFFGLLQWVLVDCVVGLLVFVGIIDINIEDDQGIYVCLIVCDVEGWMVGGYGILNWMLVKVLIVIFIGQVFVLIFFFVDFELFISNILFF